MNESYTLEAQCSMGRVSSNLEPGRSIGIDPAGDGNIEAVGPCCLDVNTRFADLAKGRFQLVWWFIWWSFAFLYLVLGMLMVSNLLGGANIMAGVASGERVVALAVWSCAFVPLIGTYVYLWRTRHPMRFNRQKRAVTLHHRGITYVEPWDGITAYIYAA